MKIDVEQGPPLECRATVTIGEVCYVIGPTYNAYLREDALEFASGLAGGRPFTPEFECEPLFNVEFEGNEFVTYLHQPRFRRSTLWWLGSRKVVSKPESVSEATAYLAEFAAGLDRA